MYHFIACFLINSQLLPIPELVFTLVLLVWDQTKSETAPSYLTVDLFTLMSVSPAGIESDFPCAFVVCQNIFVLQLTLLTNHVSLVRHSKEAVPCQRQMPQQATQSLSILHVLYGSPLYLTHVCLCGQ